MKSNYKLIVIVFCRATQIMQKLKRYTQLMFAQFLHAYTYVLKRIPSVM